MIGQTISHYRILEKLGEGGMGVVYKAHDTRLERDVALKFLPAHVSAKQEAGARFLQEARAAAALNHANICTIYGVEEHEGQMFIAMEYIEGGTLREKVPLGSIQDTFAIATQIGEGLQAAHEKGIVHRDIKADNVMLTAKGQAKVMDFGLAKLRGSLKLTKTSSTVGTLGYMSPEQIGEGGVDHRSDIFSFGVLIFEMLTGRLPFRGEHEAAMVYSIMNEEPEPVTKYLPDAPPELVLMLSKALEKDPADRYQSVAEMLVDLRRLRKSTTKVSRTYRATGPGVTGVPEGRAAGDARSGTMPQMDIGTAEGSLSSSSAASSIPETRKKSRAVIYAGVVSVIIIAAVVVMLTRKSAPPLPSVSDMTMTRMTSSGDADYCTISPDGRYLVYVRGEPGRYSLWIRQVATSGEVMVVPPTNISFSGTTVSHDGNYIFYTASLPDDPVPSVYRVPVLGGSPPRKIIGRVVGAITTSPDDSQIAFLRSEPTTGEEALFIADADGSNLRKLSSRDGKNLFYITSAASAPAWSPDGSRIACPAGRTVGEFTTSIVAVNVDDGSEESFTKSNWGYMGRIAWFPDGRGLAFCAGEPGKQAQVYDLTYPGGEISRLTNDLNVYGPVSLSITGDGSAVVTTQTQWSYTIWVVPGGDAKKAREVTHGAGRSDGMMGMDWEGNERIVYSSWSGSSVDLWVVPAGGGTARQLTVSKSANIYPEVSNSLQRIFYVSREESIPHIWSVKTDGSDPRRLTHHEDYRPSVTPDGKWLLFDSWRSGTQSLWKMDPASGDTAVMFLQNATSPRFSPDGGSVLCRYYDREKKLDRVSVVDFPGGAVRHIFDLPLSADLLTFRWSPDGKAVEYVDTRNGVSNIMAYDPATGTSKQVTQFETDRITSFAWSKDGKNLAVARGPSATDIVMLKRNDSR